MPSTRSLAVSVAVAAHLALVGCTDGPEGLGLSKSKSADAWALSLGDRVPDASEAATVGALAERIERGHDGFARLVRCSSPDVVFKDEEGTGADRMMTPRLRSALLRLAPLVAREWPDLRLRVTEAWDEKHEHGPNSIHYEGRAADLTTSDVDPRKLGRLSRLAVEARLDWVFYEDPSHIHVSVRR